jgi:hypothetical protein
MSSPHYLRFVQALVLAAAVPACSDAAPEDATPSNDPAPTETSQHADAPRTIPTGTVASTTTTTVDASVDSSLPHTSGPIAPPELA